MQYRIVVDQIVILPDQVVISLVVMEYCAVIMPAHIRAIVRLSIPLLEVQRFEGQTLERDINRALYRDVLTLTVKPSRAIHDRTYRSGVRVSSRKYIETAAFACCIRES